MKVAFLNPPRLMERVTGDFAIMYNVSRFSRGVDVVYGIAPPTELAILAAAVAKRHEVKILDANALNLFPGEVCEWIRTEKPDFLVIRAGDTTLTQDVIYYHYAESIGVGAILWEDMLNPVYSDRLMADFHVKRVLYGEPERKIFDFLEGAVGLCGGDIIEDINTLPLPLMEALPMHAYVRENKRNWYSFLQRGCSWGKCSFCLIAPRVITHRMRGIEHIRAELEALRQYGTQTIYYWDPQINPSKQRVMELCELFSHFPYKWEAWARVDVLDGEIAQAMRRSGCFRLHIGVENGDQNVLYSYNKGITIEMIHHAFSVLKTVGIERAAYLCMGTPGESEESFKHTIKLIKAIKPTTIVAANYRPFPNAPLTEEAKKQGLLLLDHYDLSIRGDCFGTATVTRTKHLDEKELNIWMRKIQRLSTRIAFRSYIMRPRTWAAIGKIFLIRSIRNFLIGRRTSTLSQNGK
jgi:radical SAM superfamily enzyme YgiQ (UPF0313 family)